VPRDLRKFAEHQPCYLRLFPFCRPEPGNVVLAHIRRGGTAGGAQKPADINGVPACFHCHAVYDGKKQKEYTREQLDAEMLRAHCQWLDYLVKEEIVIVVLAA
jgi:hypothetical protein